MTLSQNKATLISKINEIGLTLDPDKKYKNIELIQYLGSYYFHFLQKEKQTWGLQKRIEIETPMLLSRYTELKQDQQKELFESNKWIAEPKLIGNRCLICYHPDEGFTFLSRNYSEAYYLPVDYTDKILLINNQNKDLNIVQQEGILYDVTKSNKNIHTGSFYKRKMKYPFILDCEIIFTGNIDSNEMRKYGTVTASEQNAATAVLGLGAAESHQIQIEQFPFKFYIFDCLFYQDWIMNRSYQDRKFIQETVVSKLIQSFNLPFENVIRYITKQDKEDAWESQLNNKGEGLVFKQLDKPYHPFVSRQKDYCVKLKRTMQIVSDKLDLSDIDCFISGYILPSPVSKYPDYIGGVEFSVILVKKNGIDEIEHVLATITEIDLATRRNLSEIGPDGLPRLKEEYYDKVCHVDGMSITKDLKLTHPRSRINIRSDKTKFESRLLEQFLIDNII